MLGSSETGKEAGEEGGAAAFPHRNQTLHVGFFHRLGNLFGVRGHGNHRGDGDVGCSFVCNLNWGWEFEECLTNGQGWDLRRKVHVLWRTFHGISTWLVFNRDVRGPGIAFDPMQV